MNTDGCKRLWAAVLLLRCVSVSSAWRMQRRRETTLGGTVVAEEARV